MSKMSVTAVFILSLFSQVCTLYIFYRSAPLSADFAQVSSFYGPGATIGWLILAVQVLASEIKLFWSNSRERNTAGNDIEIQLAASFKTHSLDTSLCAFMTYPILAIVDYWRRRFATQFASDPQYHAALTFIRLSITIGSTNLNSHALRPRTKSLSRSRWLAWVNFGLLHSTVSVGQLLDKFQNQVYMALLLIVVSIANAVLPFWINRRYPPRGTSDTKTAFCAADVLLCFSAIIGLAIPPVWSMSIHGQGPPFLPRTASRISDLDQAAALGTALVLACFPICQDVVYFLPKQCSKWLARLNRLHHPK